METANYRRVVELVDVALDLEPRERSAFLDRECAGMTEVRAEVEALLAEEESLGSDFLAVPAVLQAVDLIAGERRPESPRPGGEVPPLPETIGPYRVLDELGRGGMGIVYLAEQSEPIERRVALKVVHGFREGSGGRRFAAECRALARLKHPNIAAVYDAGVTADGRAFVAMEWVEGTHITTWCDDNRLSIRSRLELFLGVCAAVGHAHQKGLVHQDLKPSNVLVAMVDGRATAKVIDFGIARSLDEAESAASEEFEATGQGPGGGEGLGQSQSLLMGSPIYMSPEATLLTARADVDVRTDVYSLGVVLYELLAGVLPLDVSGLGVGTLLDRVRTTDPPKLSQRWESLALDRRLQLAASRGVSAEALGGQFRGDLDAILAKATARDRESRYDSVSDLGADLTRHFENRPVAAREPTLAYNLSRYVRRNLGAVVAVAAVIGVLAAGVVARTQEARRANVEAERARRALTEAEQVSDFLIGLFEVVDPDRRSDAPESVDELLAKAEATMDEELADQPLARARFLQTLGRIAMNRMDLDGAATAYEQALALRELHQPPEHPDLIICLGSLGVVYRRQGRLDEAETHLVRAIDLIESSGEGDPGRLAATITWLANLHFHQSRFEEAIAGHRRALEIRRGEVPRNLGAIGESLNNLGVALRDAGRQAEARSILLEADTFFAQGLGAEHPLTLASWFNLAGIEEHLGRWQEAEDLLTRCAETWHRVHGPTHHRTLLARRALGALWRRWHRLDQAVDSLSELLAVQESEAGGNRLEISRTLVQLGRSRRLQGDLDGAERELLRALEILAGHYGADHLSTLRVRADLALLDSRRGDLEGAATILEELAAATSRQLGEGHLRSAWMFHQLGKIQREQGRLAEAEDSLTRALQVHEAAYDGPSTALARDLVQLGRLRRAQGQPQAGRELLVRAVGLFEEVLPADHPELAAARAAASAATP